MLESSDSFPPAIRALIASNALMKSAGGDGPSGADADLGSSHSGLSTCDMTHLVLVDNDREVAAHGLIFRDRSVGKLTDRDPTQCHERGKVGDVLVKYCAFGEFGKCLHRLLSRVAGAFRM